MKPGELKIMNTLMRLENGLTFTELKEETELSPPVLSEYLKSLTAAGLIDRNANRKYKVKRIFLPFEKLSEREQAMRFLASSAPALAIRIKQEKNEEKRTKLVREFLKMYLMFGGSIMALGVINHSLDEWVKGGKNLDSFLPILNEQIGQWITPYIQKLALALILNIEDVRKNEVAMNEISQHWLAQLEKTLSFFECLG